MLELVHVVVEALLVALVILKLQRLVIGVPFAPSMCERYFVVRVNVALVVLVALGRVFADDALALRMAEEEAEG